MPPWGASFAVARGVRGQAPPLRHPRAVGAGVRAGGPSIVPLVRMPCGGCVPRAWPGLSLEGLACHRCEGRLASAAVPPPAACPPGRAAGVPRPVCLGRSWRGRGGRAPAPQRAPLGSPGGSSSAVVRASEVSRFPSSDSPPSGRLSGSARNVLWARVCGCGGPAVSPCLSCPASAACRGGGGGPYRGGLPCPCCEGRLVSGAVPPSAARPQGLAAGVLRPVCPGCGWRGRGDPAPAPQPHSPAALRAGVARCGDGGGGSQGGCLLPSGGASEVRCSPSPDCPASGRAVGVRSPRAVGAEVRVWGFSTVPWACMPCGS